MTHCSFNVFLFLILLILLYAFGQELDTRRLKYEKLNSVLFALKEYGKVNRPTPTPDPVSGATSKPSTVKQYVCATVLSANEINNFDRFEPNFVQNGRRIRSQYNEVDRNNKPIHGEKIILERYLNGLIEQMKDDNGEGIHPIVVLYSYNIPCSIQTHICAERLRRDKEEHGYSLIVGFTVFFGHTVEQTNTNKIASFDELVRGNIPTYYVRKVRNGPLVYYLPHRRRDASIVLKQSSIRANDDDSFQSLLYKCLIKQPLAFCCTTNLYDINMATVRRILSYSINSMVYSCIEKLPPNQIIDNEYRDCIKQWIQSNIGNDCHSCLSGGIHVGIGEDRSKFFIGQCAEQAEKLTNRLGGTNGPAVLVFDQPEWIRNEPIDRTHNVVNQFTRPIACSVPTLNTGSFCTKLDTSTQRVTGKRHQSGLSWELPPGKKPMFDSRGL